MIPSFDEILYRIDGFTREAFEKQKVIYPMFIGFTEDAGEVLCSVDVGGNEEAKRAVLDKVREIFRAHEVKRFAMLMESWLLREPRPGKEIMEEYKEFAGRMEEHPNREEAIKIIVGDTMEERHALIPITRNENKDGILGTMEIFPVTTTMSGIFTHILMPEPSHTMH